MGYLDNIQNRIMSTAQSAMNMGMRGSFPLRAELINLQLTAQTVAEVDATSLKGLKKTNEDTQALLDIGYA